MVDGLPRAAGVRFVSREPAKSPVILPQSEKTCSTIPFDELAPAAHLPCRKPPATCVKGRSPGIVSRCLLRRSNSAHRWRGRILRWPVPRNQRRGGGRPWLLGRHHVWVRAFPVAWRLPASRACPFVQRFLFVFDHLTRWTWVPRGVASGSVWKCLLVDRDAFCARRRGTPITALSGVQSVEV